MPVLSNEQVLGRILLHHFLLPALTGTTWPRIRPSQRSCRSGEDIRQKIDTPGLDVLAIWQNHHRVAKNKVRKFDQQ